MTVTLSGGYGLSLAHSLESLKLVQRAVEVPLQVSFIPQETIELWGVRYAPAKQLDFRLSRLSQSTVNLVEAKFLYLLTDLAEKIVPVLSGPSDSLCFL